MSEQWILCDGPHSPVGERNFINGNPIEPQSESAIPIKVTCKTSGRKYSFNYCPECIAADKHRGFTIEAKEDA